MSVRVSKLLEEKWEPSAGWIYTYNMSERNAHRIEITVYSVEVLTCYNPVSLGLLCDCVNLNGHSHS